MDDDDPDKYRANDGFEYVGLDKFLNKFTPKIFNIITKEKSHQIFGGFDVFWDDTGEATQVWSSLTTEYDFNEANSAT